MQGQINRLIGILMRYLDDILSLFEKDFKETSSALEETSKVVFDLDIVEFEKKKEKTRSTDVILPIISNRRIWCGPKVHEKKHHFS